MFEGVGKGVLIVLTFFNMLVHVLAGGENDALKAEKAIQLVSTFNSIWWVCTNFDTVISIW